MTVTANCNPSGTSTITFSASGPTYSYLATNSYPGTYTETGTITIGPQTRSDTIEGLSTGTVTAFQASFSIDSSTGQVIGTKTLTAIVEPGNPNFDNRGVCVDSDTQHVHWAGLWATYKATIAAGRRSCSDNGITDFFLRDSSVSNLYDMSEEFDSSLHGPKPLH